MSTNPRNFRRMLESKWSDEKFVCVGLDPVWDKIPKWVTDQEMAKHDDSRSYVTRVLVTFCKSIVDVTHDIVCAYKPNAAFFEAFGVDGLIALQDVIRYIHQVAPQVSVIYDAKRADIGNTNNGYAQNAFGNLSADAITVNPFFGREALQPFLDQKDKGVIVLCRTSNPGAGEFQDMSVSGGSLFGDVSIPLYKYVASQVAYEWNGHGNCALVVGATYPDELAEIRRIVDDMPILIPGIGTQGGNLEKTVKAGQDSRGRGMIINSSSAIIFDSDPRMRTIELTSDILKYR